MTDDESFYIYSPVCFFGTNPKGDTLKFLNGGVLKDPAILCASKSFAIFCLIMSGALFADGNFFIKSLAACPCCYLNLSHLWRYKKY